MHGKVTNLAFECCQPDHQTSLVALNITADCICLIITTYAHLNNSEIMLYVYIHDDIYDMKVQIVFLIDLGIVKVDQAVPLLCSASFLTPCPCLLNSDRTA